MLSGHKDSASLTLHTKGRNEDLTVILRPGENAKITDEHISEWTQLDSTYSTLLRHSRFVFGFEDRQGMLDFHSTVVRKMPWLSRHESVLYTITKKELLHGDHFPRHYWFQASLDTEDLKGIP